MFAVASIIVLLCLPTGSAVTYVKNKMELYHSQDYSLQVSAPHHNMTLGINQVYYLSAAVFAPDTVTLKINGGFIRSISGNSLILESFKVQSGTAYVNVTFENQTALKLSMTWRSGWDIVPIPDDDDWKNWLDNYTKQRETPKNAMVIDLVIPFGNVALGIGLLFSGFVVVGVFTFRRKNRSITQEVAKSTDPSGALSESWEKATGVPQEPTNKFRTTGKGGK